jgi:hypothetical protein
VKRITLKDIKTNRECIYVAKEIQGNVDGGRGKSSS